MTENSDGFDSPVENIYHMVDKNIHIHNVFNAMRHLVHDHELTACYGYIAEKRNDRPAAVERQYLVYVDRHQKVWVPDAATVQWVVDQIDSLVEDRISQRRSKKPSAGDEKIAAVGRWIIRQYERTTGKR